MYMSLSTAILSHFHTEARAECFSSGFNYQLPDKLSTFFFLEWPYLGESTSHPFPPSRLLFWRKQSEYCGLGFAAVRPKLALEISLEGWMASD